MRRPLTVRSRLSRTTSSLQPTRARGLQRSAACVRVEPFPLSRGNNRDFFPAHRGNFLGPQTFSHLTCAPCARWISCFLREIKAPFIGICGISFSRLRPLSLPCCCSGGRVGRVYDPSLLLFFPRVCFFSGAQIHSVTLSSVFARSSLPPFGRGLKAEWDNNVRLWI